MLLSYPCWSTGTVLLYVSVPIVTVIVTLPRSAYSGATSASHGVAQRVKRSGPNGVGISMGIGPIVPLSPACGVTSASKPVVLMLTVMEGVSWMGPCPGVVTFCAGTSVVGGRQMGDAVTQMAGAVSGGVVTFCGGTGGVVADCGGTGSVVADCGGTGGVLADCGGTGGVDPIGCEGIVKGSTQRRFVGVHVYGTVTGSVVTFRDGTPFVVTFFSPSPGVVTFRDGTPFVLTVCAGIPGTVRVSLGTIVGCEHASSVHVAGVVMGSVVIGTDGTDGVESGATGCETPSAGAETGMDEGGPSLR